MRCSKEVQAAIEKAVKDGTATETTAAPGAYIRTGEARGLVPAFASEAEFQAEVIIAARMRGWRVAAFRKVRVQRKNGSVYYETPVQADGAGWPDLMLFRGPQRLAMELKMPGNKASEQQLAWGAVLVRAGFSWAVYFPADWEHILEVLK